MDGGQRTQTERWGVTDPFSGDLLSDLAVTGHDTPPEAGAAEWTLAIGAPVVHRRRHARLGQQRRQGELLRRPAAAADTQTHRGHSVWGVNGSPAPATDTQTHRHTDTQTHRHTEVTESEDRVERVGHFCKEITLGKCCSYITLIADRLIH